LVLAAEVKGLALVVVPVYWNLKVEEAEDLKAEVPELTQKVVGAQAMKTTETTKVSEVQ